MSDFPQPMTEPESVRRQRLITEARARLQKQGAVFFEEQWRAMQEAMAAFILQANQYGLETMADVLQPEHTANEIGVPVPRLTHILPETQALAINGVIRLLVTARTEFALKRRFGGEVSIPREEAVAMSAVVEAALGLDTSKLLDSDLFETHA